MRSYKGYTGSVEFDEDDMVFHGRIVGIRDIVTFEAETAQELVQAFRDSVDDYLAFCAERSQEPDRPFSGNLSLRMTPRLHEQVVRAAGNKAQSVNQWITDTLTEAASRDAESASMVVKA
ncbi:putative HicB family RNase H-like nuclease [Rhizobium sp. ERR 1071]|uniref:Antitoxin HicB n=1 Tax=Rhizobium dioscoreae TaxID=2653122 RepID=A0ABQ0Z4D4_9HYPH|nr:putative HicB family RNase H-like nuclease [Rhizobium sp. ERR1071]GES50143.1 antitoxin HicB [Rhizobium dioscoreae]GLU82096.1 antitoxin HicB [Rhizobium sp. NBRC 114257]